MKKRWEQAKKNKEKKGNETKRREEKQKILMNECLKGSIQLITASQTEGKNH